MSHEVHGALYNGVPKPPFELSYPDNPDAITDNLMKLADLAPDVRDKFLLKNLITHLHAFVKETSLSSDEWLKAIKFLTSVGHTTTNIRQEFMLLSDVMGVSALVDAINFPPGHGGTESTILGPFHTDDAPDIEQGQSIASEGKGEYMYIEGRVLSSDGTPISNATIESWETDSNGYYDTQYVNREKADLRGRLRTDKDGHFGFRAIVPVAYPIPGDGPVGQLLLAVGRHNMRPNHIHLIVEAPGFRKLITMFYPEGDTWLESDAVFAVKKSLVVKLQEVNDEAEARKRGFPKGSSFKLLQRDVILVPEKQADLKQ
ncbi:aromatic compound dioxygenase [Polyporus arcularius HHB13444]|uniref:Aromatic compound dioxygenase n=1 Tax=Polyporus arcularius HHB13444 TaxID=1314778 RepID=A0A5C3PBR8_9APHY|nr:aromatic compound dioxygenase [Polyporus arcularius HHB13444]